MTEVRSKRRALLTLVFTTNCLKKPLLIRIYLVSTGLQRDKTSVRNILRLEGLLNANQLLITNSK